MGWTRPPGNITLGRDDIVYRPAGRNDHGTGPYHRHRLGEKRFSTPRRGPGRSARMRGSAGGCASTTSATRRRARRSWRARTCLWWASCSATAATAGYAHLADDQPGRGDGEGGHRHRRRHGGRETRRSLMPGRICRKGCAARSAAFLPGTNSGRSTGIGSRHSLSGQRRPSVRGKS